ncbi:hypothetical protein AADZ90_018610 [Aestuariibius sp. 2305UL40-4]|uniref:hypothetical protein n=1 Tax=Aestuariibius violaceus TaxID=3234132 RepID=UPI00345EB0A9
MMMIVLVCAGFLVIGGAMTISSLLVTTGPVRILLWGTLPVLFVGGAFLFYVGTLQTGEYGGLGYIILAVGLFSYGLALGSGLTMARAPYVQHLPRLVKGLMGVLLVGVAPFVVYWLLALIGELAELLLSNSEVT